jgi:hypothetical protein
MVKTLLIILTALFVTLNSNAQTTAMQLKGNDCNGKAHDLFSDLDSGKVVLLHFYMPNCSSCPPVAKKIQIMANNVMLKYPGKIVGYAMPFENTTTCSYSTTWVNSNSLSNLYSPYSQGANQVAYYGGFGMPTVVLLGGKDHKVLFSTLSFSSSDTTFMKTKILEVLSVNDVEETPNNLNVFNISPNPANDNISILLELKENSNIIMEIVDLQGKIVAKISEEKNISNFKNSFNISNLVNGEYFVRLKVNDITTTRKLSIVR